MKSTLCLLLVLSLVSATLAATCTDNVQDLANVLSQYQVSLATCNADNICDSDSQCREALRDYFDYIEACAEQISGSNVDFSSLSDFYDNLIQTSCDLTPGDLADLYFAVCPNSQSLISASQKVLDECPTEDGFCSDACTNALAAYYKQLYECFAPGFADENVAALRAIFEGRCELISDAQSCIQVAIANIHDINDACAGSDGFQCTSDCQDALESAAATAAANCASGASDLLAQYTAACTGDCGASLNEDFQSVQTECAPLSDLTTSSDECDACASAIQTAINDAQCLGTGNAATAALQVLSAIAAQACVLDPAAKDLADGSVFSELARNVGTQCRARGLCTSECQDAIDALKDKIDDEYDSNLLSVPSSVKNALQTVAEYCDVPFTGFPHRILAVIDNINCAAINSASFDYIFRLAQIFGLNPNELIITDCTDSVTRATSASVTLGASSAPDDAKPSDCSSVSLTCSEIDTKSTSGSSPASVLMVSSFGFFLTFIMLLF